MAKRTLAVVVITRNEERNIERGLRALLRETQAIPDVQIVLVDSVSEDRTVEIARRFPINIIQLRPHWPRTPGAGRYLGTLATDSEFIQFLDGDTEIYPGWLPQALEFLRHRPEVGGVGGTRDEFYLDEQGRFTGEVWHRYRVPEPTPVGALGGDGLYRRSALEVAGTFHPYLALYEETELALRLRKAGYSLWRLPIPMTRHFSRRRGTLREAVRRFRVGFYPRAGRTLRATFQNGLGLRFIRERLMPYLVTFVYLSLGVPASVAAALGWWGWLAAWLVVAVVIFAIYSVRKGSPRRAFDLLVARLMVTYGLVVGYVVGGQRAEQYPTDYVVVKQEDELCRP